MQLIQSRNLMSGYLISKVTYAAPGQHILFTHLFDRSSIREFMDYALYFGAFVPRGNFISHQGQSILHRSWSWCWPSCPM